MHLLKLTLKKQCLNVILKLVYKSVIYPRDGIVDMIRTCRYYLELKTGVVLPTHIRYPVTALNSVLFQF